MEEEKKEMSLKDLITGIRGEVKDDSKVIDILISMANDGKILLKDVKDEDGEDKDEDEDDEDDKDKKELSKQDAGKLFGLRW